jgi:hypothetical protein
LEWSEEGRRKNNQNEEEEMPTMKRQRKKKKTFSDFSFSSANLNNVCDSESIFKLHCVGRLKLCHFIIDAFADSSTEISLSNAGVHPGLFYYMICKKNFHKMVGKFE